MICVGSGPLTRSRSGVPLEVVSRNLLRHSDLKISQWYIGASSPDQTQKEVLKKESPPYLRVSLSWRRHRPTPHTADSASQTQTRERQRLNGPKRITGVLD